MTDWLQQIKSDWDRTADSDWYNALRTEERIAVLEKDPASAFHPQIYDLIARHLPRLGGKQVLLPSSGDNHAAFAFALLGAEVTSADISENQLAHAKRIAGRLGLSIRFVCEDTMGLASIQDGQFDLVYTSNGTHTWIYDLEAMYRAVHRVLKPGGISLMYDVHPFQRPFTGEPWKQPRIKKPYQEVMPHCHWRVQDLMNAMLRAGLSIREVAELPAADPSFWFSYEELRGQTEDALRGIDQWERNPLAALPAWLSVIAQK